MINILIKIIKNKLKKNFSFLRYKKKLSSKIIRNVKIDEGTRIGPYVLIDGEAGSILIGKNCSINSFSWLGGGNSILSIGNDVRIGTGTVISCANHIFKDKNLLIRQQGLEKNSDITIEDDVWIGANSTILPGVKIQKGSVIGAGSVVTKDIESYVVAVGNPAKKIKER